jgi:uncharacterized membrane protein
LRRQYANSGITLIPKEASALVWAGATCLGMAVFLVLQATSLSLRLVLAGFVIFAFVWLAIIPLRNLLASWHKKSGLSS